MSARRAGATLRSQLPRYPHARRRTMANAAIVEGFFAFLWFGWGQEGPPAVVSILLTVGAFLAVVVVGAGVMAARRARGGPSPFSGAAAGRLYTFVVAVEFGLSGLGAAVLGATGHPDFIAAWVCVVVGVHFVPLSRIFPRIGLVVLGGLISLVGIAAIAVGLTTEVLPSTITAMGAGGCLLGHSATLLAATAGATPCTSVLPPPGA